MHRPPSVSVLMLMVMVVWESRDCVLSYHSLTRLILSHDVLISVLSINTPFIRYISYQTTYHVSVLVSLRNLSLETNPTSRGNVTRELP